ncbi:MAG: DUF4192 domain-containing protein, partial [Nocardioidaceae bacterium]
MPSVMRARSSADLISVIPAMLGFHPHESLVAIAVHRPRQRLGFRLRVDLPPPEHADAVADQVVSYLRAQDPDEVLLVAFSDRPEEAGPVVHAVRDRLAGEEIDLTDAIRCDGSRYWSYLCDDPRCCPPDGTPYESDSNVLLAEAVFQGVEVLPSRDALVDRFASVTGALRQDMVEATTRVEARLEAAAGTRPRDRDPELLRAGIDEVTPIVDGFELDPGRRLTEDEVAVLSVWTSLIVVRDVLWARLTRANAQDHLTMWRQVAARVVPPYEPPTLSLAAFAAWLSGSGAQAQCALDRVAEADPSYSMA